MDQARESAFQVIQSGAGEIMNLASNVCTIAAEIRNRLIGSAPIPTEKEGPVPTGRAFCGYAGRMIETQRNIADTLILATKDLEALVNEIPKEKLNLVEGPMKTPGGMR